MAEPSLSEVIGAHIMAANANQHTSIPAKVLTYNPVNQTVDVKVAINTKLSNDVVVERGAIRGVPVQFGGTTRTLMSFPIVAGDTGMLVFQERSIDEWTTQPPNADASGSVHANDRRMHDYNDCVFVPGIHPYSASPVGGRGHTYKHDPLQDTVIKHNIGTPAECYMFLKPDGSILFQNKEVNMQLLVDGTLKVDCKNVIVNADTSITSTTINDASNASSTQEFTSGTHNNSNAPLTRVSNVLTVGNGATGTFTTPLGSVVTVQDGIVTNIT